MIRYVATTLVGDGTETNPIPDLQLTDENLVVPLSDWPRLEATLTPEHAVQLTAGSSCIYTVADGGKVLAATIVDTLEEVGPAVKVTAFGFTSAPKDTPWVGAEQKLYHANSGDVFRSIWAHLQSQPGGNLGLTLTPFTTEAWVGRNGTQTSDGVTTDVDEPYVLSPRSTRDLSERIGVLLDDGIQFREKHGLAGNHTLDCGMSIGDDLTSTLRFEVGANVTTDLSLWTKTVDSPTEVLVVGTGDTPPWGLARLDNPGRLRKVAVITDATVSTDAAAAARAQERLAKYARRVTSFTITVADGPLALIGSYDVGDTIAVTGPRWGGGTFTSTGRITSITYKPADGTAELDITPPGANA